MKIISNCSPNASFPLPALYDERLLVDLHTYTELCGNNILFSPTNSPKPQDKNATNPLNSEAGTITISFHYCLIC